MPLQLRIPIEDDMEDTIKFIEMIVYTNALEKIYKCMCQNHKVLVYSNFGQQRSCALVACFLIKYLRMKPVQAIKFVCNKRKQAFLSSGINDNHFEHTIHFYYEYLQLEKENRFSNKNKKDFQKIDENKKKTQGPRIQPI
jgi:protein-tyrosine phosphatase